MITEDLWSYVRDYLPPNGIPTLGVRTSQNTSVSTVPNELHP